MPETIRKLFRPGSVTYLAVGAVALVMIGWGIVVSVPGYTWESRRVEPLTNFEVAVILGRVGLDAAPLAAVGATPVQVGAVVEAARDHLEGEIQTVRDADAAFMTAQADAERLERLVRTGMGTPSDVNALAAARAALATATAERGAALDAVFEAASDGLSGSQVATLSAIRAGRASGWTVPLQYLAVSREEADWIALRDALAHQDITGRLGLEIDPEAQQRLLAENALGGVAAAKSNLDNHLQGISTAWNAITLP